jgi:hypothetical protein
MTIGYRCITIAQEFHYEHRLAWFYVHGAWPNFDIDHKNHIVTDNSISNLRDASTSNNIAHKTKPRRDNKSGVTGVHFDNNKKRWTISIGDKFGGSFKRFEDAVSHRKALEIVEYGEFKPKG